VGDRGLGCGGEGGDLSRGRGRRGIEERGEGGEGSGRGVGGGGGVGEMGQVEEEG